MLQSHKIVLNTIALYIKIILNALVSIYSTRLVLSELGVESFGLYNLIAGVIAMLSFFTGALMVSSQRFLSISLGEKNYLKLNKVFNISLLVHFILSVLIGIIFKGLQPFLFNGFLNIDESLISDAVRVYDIMIISSIVTIFTIPYSAVINAREDMWFFSISEVLVALFKLLAAVAIIYIDSNKLMVYTILMLNAIVIGWLVNLIWCRIKYKECKISFENMKDKLLFKEIFSFAGWNMLGAFAMVTRNQGIAVTLNLFFGTFINAAYGVANQLNAIVITFASTLTTVFTPMIIRAKGEGNEKKMLFISIFSSKISFLLSSVIAVPVLIHTKFILDIWLKKIPENTIEFCQNIVITFLIMQLYPGITRAIYATGKIKLYQIIISILLFSNIPIGYILFKNGYPAVSILYIMIGLQLLTLIATTYFAKRLINLNFLNFVVYSVVLPILFFLGVYSLGVILQENLFVTNKYINFISTSVILVLVYITIYYIFIFNKNEKDLLKKLIESLKQKFTKRKFK